MGRVIYVALQSFDLETVDGNKHLIFFNHRFLLDNWHLIIDDEDLGELTEESKKKIRGFGFSAAVESEPSNE